MNTRVLLDHEPVADGGFLVRALLFIEGEPPPSDGRTAINLSLVLDRSGSMMGEPLAAAKDAAATLVRRLDPTDTVSVVAYDQRVRDIAPPARGDDQALVSEAIAQIESGGTTNLSGGWLRGRDLVADGLLDGGVNRVMLLTDGLANEGITDPATLIGLCRTAAASGVSTTTVGFGPHFDEDLLRAMAEAGGGGAYYIERADQAGGVFEEELEGLLSISAQNVRVRVRPGADAESLKVLHDYPSHVEGHAEGETLTLEVGDLYAREPRRVLLEILLTSDMEARSEADVAEIEVEAHVLTAEGGLERRTVALPISLTPEAGGRVDQEVRSEVVLLEAAKAREEALEAQKRGDWRAGMATLNEASAMLRERSEYDPRVAEELDDLEQSAAQFAAEELSSADIKYMKQRSYSSRSSRREQLERYRRTKDGEE